MKKKTAREIYNPLNGEERKGDCKDGFTTSLFNHRAGLWLKCSQGSSLLQTIIFFKEEIDYDI